jgi:hypothetical protein
MAPVASFSDVSILAATLSDSLRIIAARRKAVFDDTKGDASVNGLKRIAVIAAMATIGLVACGDDTNSPAPAGSNPAPVGTTAMVDNTTAMVDNTTAMVDDTTAMVDDTTGG